MIHGAFNSATVLLKPEVDASKRQILLRNNFLTAGNKVKLMIAAENKIKFEDFKPK